MCTARARTAGSSTRSTSSNVAASQSFTLTVNQIAAVREIAPIASVQISLSPFDDENLRNGVAEYVKDNPIRLIAHRPLGGDRIKQLAKNKALVAIATGTRSRM